MVLDACDLSVFGIDPLGCNVGQHPDVVTLARLGDSSGMTSRAVTPHVSGKAQAMIIATLERVAALLDAKEIEAAPVLDVGDLDRIVAEQGAKSGS